MKKLSYILLLSIFLITACKDDKTVNRDLETYEDWMTAYILDKGDAVTMKNISVPRAHDAGTYVLSSCTIGANACNTKTQDLDMTLMLKAGIRMYDIRPVWINNDYYTQHVTECGDLGLGCQGDLMSNMLEQTKDFLDTHSELVVFSFGNWCNTSPEDADFLALVKEKLGDRLYTENETSTVDFINKPIGDIVDVNGAKGKVIILYSGAENDAALRAEGIFSYSHLPMEGSYANSYDFNEMSSDQISKFNNYDESNNSIFRMSWTMTLDAGLSVLCALNDSQSIESYANEANGQLESSMDALIADGTISKGNIVNVVSVDFADEFVTDVCFKLTDLNLNE